MSQDLAEQNIQMWKVKKLIKSLDSARGYVANRRNIPHLIMEIFAELEHP